MVEAIADAEVQNQATAMAEAILPQLDARIDARMETELNAQVAAQLEELGVLDADGALAVRPPQDPEGDTPLFADFGEQLQAIRQASMAGQIADPRLGQIMAQTGMSEGVPEDGGFLLQESFSNEIFRLIHDTGQVWNRITRRIPIGLNSASIQLPGIDETSRADGSRWGGVQAFWVGEGDTGTASRPKFKRVRLDLNKLMALSYATNEQLQDTPVIASLTTMGFGEEMGFKLDDAVINGSGVGEPLGVLNAGATISVAKETGQAAATIVAQNVIKMWARMWARSRGNAAWFINQSIEPQLYTLSLAVGTGGIPIYMPAGGLSASPFGTLFGRPVVPIEQTAALGTVGDIILADMSQYWAIEKGGINNASSMHVQFVTDETAFRATYRADARPMWQSALTPYSAGDTVGPFITLATRA